MKGDLDWDVVKGSFFLLMLCLSIALIGFSIAMPQKSSLLQCAVTAVSQPYVSWARLYQSFVASCDRVIVCTHDMAYGSAIQVGQIVPVKKDFLGYYFEGVGCQ